MSLLLVHTRTLSARVRRTLLRETGASLVEYALLVGLIAVVCFAAIALFGSEVSEKLSEVASDVDKI
jgi:Flp pilus assembly pilin Flp